MEAFDIKHPKNQGRQSKSNQVCLLCIAAISFIGGKRGAMWRSNPNNCQSNLEWKWWGLVRGFIEAFSRAWLRKPSIPIGTSFVQNLFISPWTNPRAYRPSSLGAIATGGGWRCAGCFTKRERERGLVGMEKMSAPISFHLTSFLPFLARITQKKAALGSVGGSWWFFFGWFGWVGDV